jgi:lipopolysaccharide transport system ATP-binding protein
LSNQSDALIRVDSVAKKFAKNFKLAMKYGVRDSWSGSWSRRRPDVKPKLRKGEFWALQDISFELRRGDRLGILGGNGAGKSTLMKLCSGLLQPDCGSVKRMGTIDQMIEITSGFHPLMSGFDNARFRARLKGISAKEFDDLLPDLVKFTELDGFIHSPVRNYSSGMKARLGFAVATLRKPDILIIDEALAVGDLNFRLKCYEFIAEYLQDTALLFVSHSLGHVKRFCNIGMVLEGGRATFFGGVQDAIEVYQKASSDSSSSSKSAELNGDKCSFGFANPPLTDGEVTYTHGDTIVLSLCVGSLTGVGSAMVNLADMHNRTFYEWHSDLTSTEVTENSKFKIKLDNCPLSAGYYQLNIVLFGSDGFTLKAYTQFKKFRVVGIASAGSPLVAGGCWVQQP